MIHIHPVTDLDLIASLDRRIFPEDTPVLLNGKWWAAFKGRIPVGFAGIRPLTANPDIGYLSRSGVVVGARGQGLQKRFINARARWARQNEIHTLITYTKPDNIWSSNNLIRAGFLTYEPEENYAGENVIYWMKKL